MSAEQLRLQDVAESVADGSPVDWDALDTSSLSEHEQRIVRHLRLVATVASVHRDESEPYSDRTRTLPTVAGELSSFLPKAAAALGARRWILDSLVTDVIHIQATLSISLLEREFADTSWKFALTPFLRPDVEPDSLVFLALYPSGLIRGISIEISKDAGDTVATLINPLCLIDPATRDSGQGSLRCELQLVGVPYQPHARAS